MGHDNYTKGDAINLKKSGNCTNFMRILMNALLLYNEASSSGIAGRQEE